MSQYFTYMAWYFGVGFAFFLGAIAKYRLDGRTDPLYRPEDFWDTGTDLKVPWRLFLSYFGIPVLLLAIIVVLWPAILIAIFMDWRKNLRGGDSADPPVFRVERQDLVEALDVRSIEARERVLDPMQAVPDLPFGHLNARWLAFLDGLIESEVLWSFRAQRLNRWKELELYEGYVRVAGKSVGEHLLTQHRKVHDEEFGTA